MRSKIIKTFVKVIIILFIFSSGFYFLWLYPRFTVPVLTYHSFDYAKGLLFVSPENFERQMHYLKDKGFKVIPLDELVEGIKNKKKFAHNTVVITIDDGYENNFTYAYPVLKKYGFPAIIFLITNDIGIHENFLNWDEVKEMSKNNISFGGHTKNHIYLPSVKKEDVLWDEIAGCKKAIEEHLGIPVDYFCYPLGGFTEEAKITVKKAGYKGACVTNRGDDILNRYDLYELNRVSVRNTDPYFSFSNLLNPIRFRAKLSGYYNIFREEKRGY
ncbi:MAG: polysaccharide deacetylase family protein [Candidatus Omnitrophica bacterium]|nr:polysaccharide deacetylase family protein [Candidatus Omnitrophota bacterium]